MTRYLLLILFVAMTALSAEEVSTLSPASDQTRTVTFNKDVLPILENNCQSCHRPGGIGPMSLLTYENSRPWAKAIKTAVVSKKMPPWFADPHYGEFRNAPKLSESDIKTLVAWADSGSSEGSAADKTSVSPE
jgi:mono/diheme cytochrome c family protein